MTTEFISVSSTSEQTITDSCQLSEFGCCPDGATAASGYNLEGCLGVDFDNCTDNPNNIGLSTYFYFFLNLN